LALHSAQQSGLVQDGLTIDSAGQVISKTSNWKKIEDAGINSETAGQS